MLPKNGTNLSKPYKQYLQEPLKLHLGCGGRYFEGYINIDIMNRGRVDILVDARYLFFGDETAQLIESYHLIEHIPRYELLPTLKRWQAILTPGGRMIAEFPDFDRACQLYLKHGIMLGAIYGGQRWPSDVHYFGYNFRRLKSILREAGFIDIVKKEAQDYHTKEMPCLRVECIKK